MVRSCRFESEHFEIGLALRITPSRNSVDAQSLARVVVEQRKAVRLVTELAVKEGDPSSELSMLQCTEQLRAEAEMEAFEISCHNSNSISSKRK